MCPPPDVASGIRHTTTNCLGYAETCFVCLTGQLQLALCSTSPLAPPPPQAPPHQKRFLIYALWFDRGALNVPTMQPLCRLLQCPCPPRYKVWCACRSLAFLTEWQPMTSCCLIPTGSRLRCTLISLQPVTSGSLYRPTQRCETYVSLLLATHDTEPPRDLPSTGLVTSLSCHLCRVIVVG